MNTTEGLACPKCGSRMNGVTYTWAPKSRMWTRRRRECHGCGERFTTYERMWDERAAGMRSFDPAI